MKLKPKGRKIYRKKTRFERLNTFFHNARALGGMALLLCILMFIGISAGVPLMRFLEDRGIITNDRDGAAHETLSVTEAVSETALLEIESETEQAEDTAPTQAETTPQAAVYEMHGYVLDTDALTTETSLREALTQVPKGTTHVILPLKTRGGEIHYATTLSDASVSGAVVAAQQLASIADAVTDNGFLPVAYLNILEDTLYPQSYPAAGYTMLANGELWLDDTPENDGKPWLSPFSSLTTEFASKLAEEIEAAGIPAIICDGLSFPVFSKDDLAVLGAEVHSVDRYRALASVADAMRKTATTTEIYYQLKGSEVLAGTSEILTANPSTSGYIITVTEAELSRKMDMIGMIPDGVPSMFQLEGEGDAAKITADGNYILHPTAEIPEEPDMDETEDDEEE